MPIRLAFSLHAPDDELRSQIMPINDRHPIARVLEACARLLRAPPPPGVHRVRDARRRQRHLPRRRVALAELLDPKIYKVNLIPYNPTGMYDGSSPGAIAAFKAVLEEHGVRATVRLTRGRDIDAACGQLAAKLRRASSALLAGAQQAVAQRGLVLRARVPLRDLGQIVERAQPEQLQEQRRGAVEDRRRTASGRTPRSARARPARRSPTRTRRRGCGRPPAARPAAGSRRSPASRPGRA